MKLWTKGSEIFKNHFGRHFARFSWLCVLRGVQPKFLHFQLVWTSQMLNPSTDSWWVTRNCMKDLLRQLWGHYGETLPFYPLLWACFESNYGRCHNEGITSKPSNLHKLVLKEILDQIHAMSNYFWAIRAVLKKEDAKKFLAGNLI